MIGRLPGWEAELARQIERARDVPFRWGLHDCATWAFDVRLALTGQDAAVAWRGLYSTERGAARMLRRLGHDTLAGLCRAILGDPIQPLCAQRGDIVLADGAIGVCVGGAGVFVAREGFTSRPMGAAAMAWKV